jgi:hypothetical protein
MATIKFAAPAAAESVLTTELNSLANAAGTAASAAISNDAAGELYLYGDFEVYLAAQASNRAAGARVDLYILIELDGTNYGSGGSSPLPPMSAFIGSLQFDSGATAARYAHLRQVQLPPTDFKVVAVNNTGQALASSNNTVKVSRYNLQSA